jgi:hypothetical protein
MSSTKFKGHPALTPAVEKLMDQPEQLCDKCGKPKKLIFQDQLLCNPCVRANPKALQALLAQIHAAADKTSLS